MVQGSPLLGAVTFHPLFEVRSLGLSLFCAKRNFSSSSKRVFNATMSEFFSRYYFVFCPVFQSLLATRFLYLFWQLIRKLSRLNVPLLLLPFCFLNTKLLNSTQGASARIWNRFEIIELSLSLQELKIALLSIIPLISPCTL